MKRLFAVMLIVLLAGSLAFAGGAKEDGAIKIAVAGPHSGDLASYGLPTVKAAEILGVLPEHCLVVEDAISGVQAGKAAGAKVLALKTSFTSEELAAADWITETLATAEDQVLDW
jgi:phosphoglycolate phosphatase-like HAD superfamily hydrolase